MLENLINKVSSGLQVVRYGNKHNSQSNLANGFTELRLRRKLVRWVSKHNGWTNLANVIRKLK